MAEPRLVAIGRKYPEYETKYFTYATGDPAWHPQRSPQTEDEMDPSDYRKQEIEQRIANG